MHAKPLLPARDLDAGPGLASLASRNIEHALATLALWHRRASMRRRLARWASGQGNGFIEGTGIASNDAFAEANKPFWKA